MPRIRSLKPGFFKNEVLGELSPLHRLAFAGLWVCADRDGRLEDRPKRLKAEIFPYEKDVDLDLILWDLMQQGFVVRYHSSHERYIEVLTWDKHQHPRQDEPESAIPAYAPGMERLRVDAPDPYTNGVVTVTDPSLSSDRTAPAQRMGTGVLDLGSGDWDLGTGAALPARTCQAQGLVDAWNETTELPMPPCRELTKDRRRKIQARLRGRPNLEEWRDIFVRMQASAFCRGVVPGRGGGPPWVADFDWIIANDTNAAKVVDGKFDDRSPPRHTLVRGLPSHAWLDRCSHEPRCGSPTICENASIIEAARHERQERRAG